MTSISGLPDSTSDALSLMRMRGQVVCVGDYRAPWSLRFDEPVAHFHVVERGSAWLCVDGERPIRLEPGDLALLPLGAGHTLSSDPDLPAVPVTQAVTQSGHRDGIMVRLGGDGQATHFICGKFAFSGVLAPRLLTVLPALIHVDGREGSLVERLQLIIRFLLEESRNPSPGSALMVERLLEMMFIQTIREWGTKCPHNLGWLSGLRDPLIGRALSAIHENPARPWTVEMLAQTAGLSRSLFAARFNKIVGQTPARYIAAWRLDLAADLLRSGSATIGEIAAGVGYGSEAALTRAFKRQFGVTPGRFRQDRTTLKSG